MQICCELCFRKFAGFQFYSCKNGKQFRLCKVDIVATFAEVCKSVHFAAAPTFCNSNSQIAAATASEKVTTLRPLWRARFVTVAR